MIHLITIFFHSTEKIFGPSKKVEVDIDKPSADIPSIWTDASGPLLDTVEEEMDVEFAEILKKLPVAVQISDSVSLTQTLRACFLLFLICSFISVYVCLFSFLFFFSFSLFLFFSFSSLFLFLMLMGFNIFPALPLF